MNENSPPPLNEVLLIGMSICLMALGVLTRMLFTTGSNTLPVDWSVVLYS